MSTPQSNWIKIINGQFTCSECENGGVPLVSTAEGMVEANLEDIKNDLKNFPTKIIYGVCPVCGMEYIFRLVGEDLYLEPSMEEK